MKVGHTVSWIAKIVVFLVVNVWNYSKCGAASGDDKINITRILNAFFEQGYDRRVRPNYGGFAGPGKDTSGKPEGLPVEVGITMYIISISSVSEVQMDFTTDFYFRQAWEDNRLEFKSRPGFESLTVGAEVADRIWVPDTFFANEKTAYFHKATTPNTFLRIGSKGEVFRSIRLTVTASCPMDLQYFPMDRQLCTIEIESFGYTMKDIRYTWAKGVESVGMSAEVELPQFKVLGHRQQTKEIFLTTGNYSRLVCEIMFVRSMGYYLIQIYIPASLIVIISWVSFWLHRNATPARVSLGVTTVLTMTTLMSSTNAQLPKISYVKSIDVFLGTCFVMVFASLLEYASVGFLGKRIEMRKKRQQQLAKLAEEHRKKCAAAAAAAEAGSVAVLSPGSPEMPILKSPEVCLKMMDPKTMSRASTLENAAANCTAAEIEPPPPFASKNLNKMCGVSPSDIDKYSRVVFPVCFVCFNLMYWIIYLHVSDVVHENLVPKGQ